MPQLRAQIPLGGNPRIPRGRRPRCRRQEIPRREKTCLPAVWQTVWRQRKEPISRARGAAARVRLRGVRPELREERPPSRPHRGEAREVARHGRQVHVPAVRDRLQQEKRCAAVQGRVGSSCVAAA